ncbi:hypothetical protein CI610_02866 [invertebrate metagenome]|uniref:Uncharacterized protein n=1 Tax=invertebrate metagenome TaxID=1711999 RepID=A0A2H9T4Q6_9ZZZZ
MEIFGAKQAKIDTLTAGFYITRPGEFNLKADELTLQI